MAFNAATLSFDEPETDTVYVTGVPTGTTEADVAAHFGSIGVIKQDKKRRCPRVWLYRDKATGELKGDATVTYEDPFSAGSAVQWFDGKEFRGATIKVTLAQAKEADSAAAAPQAYNAPPPSYGGGGSR